MAPPSVQAVAAVVSRGRDLEPRAALVELDASDLKIDLQVEMVRRIAYAMARHLPSHVDIDELVGLGNLGLVEARVRFDESRGVPFPAFAAQRIRGAMLDGLRQVDPLTRDERARVRREEEVSPVTLVEFTAAHDYPTGDVAADELIADHETMSLVRGAMETLSARERYVAMRYFFDEQPLKSVGEELGVTESRVCQIVGEAVAHLRKALGVEAAPKGTTPRAARIRVREEVTCEDGATSDTLSCAGSVPVLVVGSDSEAA